MNKFVVDLKSQDAPDETSLMALIQDGMEKLVRAYVREKLEDCSDIQYNPELGKALIACENFGDLIGHADNYIVRKHMRNLIRSYVTSVYHARPIQVKERTKFGVSMEYLGVNVGESTGGRSAVPDGNVLVLSMLTLAAILVAFL
jgi:hypothetical protein